MVFIKSWAFSVCCAAIIGGILSSFLPKGNTGKTFKTVLCIFFLCVVISPLSKIDIPDFNFEYASENYNFSENEFSKNAVEYVENEILYTVQEILISKNMSAEDISIQINILENGSIDINKFALTFSAVQDVRSLKNEIYQKTGIEPEIIISGEEK